MYVSEQFDQMDVRLEDPGAVLWPLPVRLAALESSMRTIVNRVHNNYLTEIQVVQTNVTVTAGAVALTGLPFRVVRGAKGIVKVRVSGGGRWLSEYDITDANKEQSNLLKSTVFNPRYHVFGNSIGILPASITSVDIWFLRMPAPLIGELTKAAAAVPSGTTFVGADAQNLSTANDAYNDAVIWESESGKYHIVTDYVGASRTFTVTPGLGAGNFGAGTFKFVTDPFNLLNLSGVEPDLNPMLHDLMIDLGVATCFEGGRDLDRWKIARSKAEDEINTLNARYEPAEGIGTDRKGR